MNVPLHTRLGFLTLLLLSGLLSCAFAPRAEAAKFVQARIERDGTKLLETTFTATDSEPNAAIWQRLAAVSFKTLGAVAADAGNAQQATLTGALQIVVVWGSNNAVGTAKVERLRLVASSEAAGRWQLPPEEVTRTASAAGLELPADEWPLLAIITVTVMLALALGVLLWLRLRREPAAGAP